MINYKITEKNYELIRNKIGEILTLELLNQVETFYNDGAEDAEVYIERFVPLDKSELSIVNVSINEGLFDNHAQGSMDGVYKIHVEIYTNSKQKGGVDADQLSAYKNQRLSGIVNAILSDPIYKTLGFSPGFIQRVRVMALSVGDMRAHEDSLATYATRLLVEVKSYENVTLPEGVPLTSNFTSVYLSDTGKGLQYVFLQDVPPPVDKRYVKIIDQEGNVLQLLVGGESYEVTVLQNIIDTITANETTITDNIID